MRVPRFYQCDSLILDTRLSLDDEACHHALKVLRLQEGERVELFDGRGRAVRGTLLVSGKRRAAVAIDELCLTERESPLAIHLGQVMSKGERMDWVMQKATELGVTRLTPLFSHRSEVRLKGDRSERKQEHWRQVIISACGQSGRNLLPELGEPTSIADWLTGTTEQVRLILHPEGEPWTPSGQPLPASVALLIGPEGGFEKDEVDAAMQAGFRCLRLGPRILRTETAPLVALSLLQHWWGDIN